MVPALVSLCVLAGCTSGGGKKVLVMASGKVAVNGNTITLKPGSSHNEVTVEPNGGKVTVITGTASKDYEVKESGLYILNIKTDTIVGSYLQTGTNPTPRAITEEEVNKRTDSLRQLMSGTNVNAQSKNYNIPPSSIGFVTKNTDAQIIGPYLNVPASFDPSQKHEIYKFYTNKEIAELLEKLDKMHSKIKLAN
ncbi:MAG: hypothetical protein ABI415_04270 [Flavitalea sp.]